MEYGGLIFEILFLGLSIYLYLFAIGVFKSKDPSRQKKSEAFRQSNGWWLRLLALAVAAIMAVNIYLHLLDLSQS